MKIAIIALFSVLLAGAIYFAAERILFCDASYILLRIVNTGWFQIQEYRYGAAVTQAFPYLGVKLGLSLSTIVLLYSMSFNIFYLAVAAWLLWLKEYGMAILLSLFFVLIVSDTYYWTNNEIHQAVGWMFLFFATSFVMARRKYSVWLQLPVFLILAFFSLFTHPLIVFSFIFLWFFYMLQPQLWPYSKRWTIGLSLLLLFILAGRFYVSMHSKYAYDSAKMHSALHPGLQQVLHVFSSAMSKAFLNRCITNYWLLPIVFVAGMYTAIRQKKLLIALLTAGFAVGYFVIMCLTFPEFVTYYSESEWASLAIIAAAPFVYFTLPLLKKNQVTMILAFIFCTRLIYIGISADKFVTRKEWIYATLDTMRTRGINKAIVYPNDQIRSVLLQNNWSQPSESMIASGLLHESPTRTFVVDSAQNIPKRWAQKTEWMSDFETGYFYKMNKRYFAFDTSSNYVLLFPNRTSTTNGPAIK